MIRKSFATACVLVLLPMGLLFAADQSGDQGERGSASRGESKDVRQRVKLPAPLLRWKLKQMRERIATIGKIQAALSRGEYDQAADMAEQDLGMGTGQTREAEDVATHMPQAMRDLETELNRAAGKFALEVRDAVVTEDVRPAVNALSNLMQRCVDCHTAYRFR